MSYLTVVWGLILGYFFFSEVWSPWFTDDQRNSLTTNSLVYCTHAVFGFNPQRLVLFTRSVYTDMFLEPKSQDQVFMECLCLGIWIKFTFPRMHWSAEPDKIPGTQRV